MSKNLIKIQKSCASLIACAAFFFTYVNSFAADFSKYKSDLNAIESYLNNISNLSANFTQEAEGNLVKGKFYLARNKESSGKMRIEYLASPKILVVVNGAVLSYYDVELDEISRLSTNTTPASFLTRPKISFSAMDVEVTNVIKAADEIKVSLLKKNRREAGEFSLIFKTSPLQFSKMEVKNDLGQIILVTLSDIDFNSEIPNKLFILKNNDL